VLAVDVAHRHAREHLGHQLPARAAHDRVARRDDERLRGDVGLQPEPTALRDVRLVDVAPQVPLAEMGIVPVAGEQVVVGALHDVREAQADDRDAAPAVELARHLLAEHLRQRVARLRPQGMLLVDRRVLGRLVERKPERRLARCPDDPLEPEARRRGEDRVRARDVRAEHDVRRRLVRRRDRRQVDDRLDAGEHLRAAQRLERLAEVGEVGGEEQGHRIRRRDEVDVEHLVAVLEQVAHDRAPGLAAASGDDDLHAGSVLGPACADTGKLA
jgi:hypothetical protein